MEVLEELPNHFIQSGTSTSTHEYFESNRASKYVMLLTNFGDEHRGLSPVSEVCNRMYWAVPLQTEEEIYLKVDLSRCLQTDLREEVV